MKRWFFALTILVFSGFCNAGYYAVIESVDGGVYPTGLSAGLTSQCYLTPSMAITGLNQASSRWTVYELDTSGNWSASYSTANVMHGKYYSCTSESKVGQLPNFSGGVSDPAISGNSILSGSFGTCSGTATAVDMATLGIDPESIVYVWSWGFGSVVLMWFLGFGIGASKGVIRKV